jgi:hypothetical protein
MPKTTRQKKSSSRPAARHTKAAAPRAGGRKNKDVAELAARLREVAGPITFREVGTMTGTHPENARRYLQGRTVGLRFFRNFCKVFNVNADWLLEGHGPKSRSGK